MFATLADFSNKKTARKRKSISYTYVVRKIGQPNKTALTFTFTFVAMFFQKSAIITRQENLKMFYYIYLVPPDNLVTKYIIVLLHSAKPSVCSLASSSGL